MDRITMKNMGFYAYHGVMAEEKVLGQRFVVSLELTLDLKAAGRSDRVADTVSYAEVYEEVRRVVAENTFDLIEKLAFEIGKAVLTNHPGVEALEVKVEKPGAPVKGEFEYFGVTLCLRPSDI
jgi:dihydroneopterin aldolase